MKCYLAGGCFWCIADYLASFSGITKIVSGYSGGEEKDVTYEEVKSQKTKHRETIEITYNKDIDLSTIIDIYLSYVDPFDKDGQYIDKGYSYTLAMYYQDEKEKELFLQKIRDLEEKEAKKPFISVEKFKFFVRAEEYHQEYSKKNPEAFYEELVASNRVCHLKKYKNNN